MGEGDPVIAGGQGAQLLEPVETDDVPVFIDRTVEKRALATTARHAEGAPYASPERPRLTALDLALPAHRARATGMAQPGEPRRFLRPRRTHPTPPDPRPPWPSAAGPNEEKTALAVAECALFIMTEQVIDPPHRDGKDPLYGGPMPAPFAFRAAEAADEGFAVVHRFEGADTMFFESR